MEEALWAYRTTYRIPIESTPYSLVYGVEAVLPLEHQIPSLRLAIQEGLTNEENVKLRLAELEALDEKRLQAQQNLECYQARISRAFNKKVRVGSFQIGDKDSIEVTHLRLDLVAFVHIQVQLLSFKFTFALVIKKIVCNIVE
ncbi:PREDICTED: uncharacterized protein LOC109168981 [Ipomoea nil]|uniref:uncharacterized protein LOC109168981 n=1 Tax=Ipomoea nil TaxID=35883 RepID=UPI000901754C|nr:PREDICTED: uncharacterized protein LOC109168981 [Ipomoea nil]